ncbi:unnamed protein product [Effrenium voratum]|nr:unnamed protein product [Effrenium voratum]
MSCCCCTENEEQHVDLSPDALRNRGLVEVQKTFADEDLKVFTVTLQGVLGITVDRSDGHRTLVREVSGGAASVWNDQNPGRRILPFDHILEVNGERCLGEDITGKFEGKEVTLKLQRPHVRSVVLERPGRLGIDVNYRKTSLTPWIAAISAGLVDDWNKKQPDLCVLPHDRISEVNGQSGTIETVLEKLRSAEKQMILTVMHYDEI